MSRKKKIISFIIFFQLFILGGLFSPVADLADFNQIYIRLDRAKTSTQTTGMVCAKPATTGTEADVQITFPTDFTVSTSISNWAVATTNITSGATAWPGIGTASSVSGQTVTFPSSDLTVGTLYCFRWTNSAALTTGSTVGSSKTVTLKTRSGSSTTIDSSTFGLYLTSNDQVSLTATVPAHPTDFQAETSSSTTGSPFAQNTTINYQLNYGSYLTYPSNITVEAEWTLGTVDGSVTPTVDLLDYVVGSASNGYGSTAPVVNLVNRKISWTITSFPANTTNQTVTFQLKTNSSYTSSSQVNFSINGRVLGPGTQTVDSTVTRSYKYVSVSGPTATPTPGPTATPGPGPTATPTPTPSPSLPQITNVEIRTISSNDATIFVGTSKKTTLVVKYGASPSNLNKILKELTSATDHLIKLGELETDTVYYFKIAATDETGGSTTSDIFTFKTAAVSAAPKIDTDSIVFSSLDVILFVPKPEEEEEKIPFILLPKDLPYSFHFSIKDHEAIDRIKMILRNKNVLGINTLAQESTTSTNSVEVFEISSGEYEGRLKSPLNTGIYELYARIFDKNGNVTENLVANIRVVNHFTVLEKGSNNPIESARVYLSAYNSKSQVFDPIPPHTFSIKNPSYTNTQGQFVFPLPLGRYKAEILAIGYEPREVIFTLGKNPGEEYPTIYLEKKPLSLIDTGLYFASVSTDLIYEVQTLFSDWSQSFRFFDFLALAVLAIFAYLTFLALSFRIKIPLHSFSFYFLHSKRVKWLGDKVEELTATVFEDKSKQPIVGADIFLLEQGGLKILAHTTTDSAGKFFFRKLPQTIYNIQVLQKGYEPSIFSEAKVLKAEETKTPLYLHKHFHSGFSLMEKTRQSVKNIIGVLFETFIVTSLFLEFILGLSLGWYKAAPFIAISVLNLILWLDHLGNKTFTKSVD